MRLRYLLLQVLFVFIFMAAGLSFAAAETRTALVIGNSAYNFAPLRNPSSDAADVAAALRNSGFDVDLQIDADQSTMVDAIRAFGEKLKNRNGTGLFFFAGHGVQVSGENFLLPIGGAMPREADLPARAVKASDVVDAMAAADNSLNIVVLDACRDNGLGKASTRGLSRIDSNARLFVSYSTSPGAVALDGQGRNSPYTAHLVQAIGTPDLTLEQAFKNTLKGVYQETRGAQTPWISSSFFGDFVFRAASRVPHIPPDALKPKSLATLTGVYRVEGRNPNGSRYKGMVALTQTGDRFSVKWWIGSQFFDGHGDLAGRMMVIHWGDKTPVVYTFSEGAVLDGEWADGTATERLTLHARASSTPGFLRPGSYRAIGYNSDGGKYQGVVRITRTGDRYRLDWKVGASAYTGEGTFEGNLLTVDWGSSTPVIYALAPDGRLSGLWDAGAGEEKLTPEQ
jgi:hypothetical protein